MDDFIFGSHRSHGDSCQKLRAIEQLSEAELEKIMNEFWDGATVAVANKGYNGSVKGLANDSSSMARWLRFLPK
ncbi:hypothetical protein MASR1M31_20310 [Porphyromonadaceae bacterium]